VKDESGLPPPILKLRQAGEPVLRQEARALSVEEIRSKEIRHLIDMMRETLRDAPGVGLAAPQVGFSLQIAVIEDAPERQNHLSFDTLVERGRVPVPFHVIINPRLTVEDSDPPGFSKAV
jgi:peptide deformylase